MSENTFQVVVSGDLAKGARIDDVKEKMATLFKTAVSNMDKLFKQKNHVIKRNVDRETAVKYQRAIERTGAVCRVESMCEAPVKRVEPHREPAREPEPARRSGPNVVPVQLMFKGEERFTPQAAGRLSGGPGGLNFNTPGFNRIAFDQLTALAAYTAIENGREIIRLLLYVNSNQRPFTFDIDAIAYADFEIKPLANPVATFRNFLHFLCRQQPTIILEEVTFDFLSGSTLPKFDQTKAEKLATAVGKAIESGDEG